MKSLLKITFFFLCISLFGSVAMAQLIPNFGGQRAGLSTLSFLKNDINPRSSSMSGASVALPGDGFANFTNPAATTDMESFNVSIANLGIGAGVKQSFVSVIVPRKKQLSAIGFSLNMMNSGAMDVRTEFQPRGTGEKFYVNNLALGLTYAQKLSDMFAAGVSLKYIHETVESYSNSAVAADVSFLYYTDYKKLKFAVMIQNFGGSTSINGDLIKSDFNRGNGVEADDYSMPTVFSLGASIVPWETEKQSLLISTQLNHPSDNAENYRVGLEYEYLKLLFLRIGIKINVEGQAYPSFGFGLRHRVGGHPLTFSYGANPTDYLGIQHNLGISFTLNTMKRNEN